MTPVPAIRNNCRRILALLLAGLIGHSTLIHGQVAVPVGSGSYASSLPAAVQFVGGYYSMTAQQLVSQYASLHLAASVTNRPLPSNKWWTDTLVGDRSYQPSGGGPRVIQQDPYGGQLWSYPVMLAPNSSGFNLYYPNAWNTPGNAHFPEGGFNTGPALPITGGVPVSVGSNDILIADFEGASYPTGWVTTGTAFGTGPIAGGTWPGESPAVQGFIGKACVNTYRGSDSPQGTLTSPLFTIQKNYLDLLVGGGNSTNLTAVWLLIGTNIVKAATGQQSGTLSWNTWDVSAYLGQQAQIEIVDASSGSWGFVLCDFIVASDNGGSPAARYASAYAPVHSEVTDWSDWGFQFGLPDALGNRMDITLARGVPFVWTTCTGVKPQINTGSATLYDTNGAVISTSAGGFTNSAFAFDYQGRSYGVFAPDNTAFLVTGSVVEAELSGTNNYLIYGLLPTRTNLLEFAQYAYARVTGTALGWTYDRTNGQLNTTWTLTTVPLKNGQTNTLQGWLPHHYRTTQNDLVLKPYTYLTPRGLMKVAAGNQFHVNYGFHGIAPLLPAPQLTGLTNDYVVSRMSNYVANFASGGHPQGNDETYGQGKEFGVTAQYMTFARELGLTNQAAQMAAGLRNLMADWFTYTPGETKHFFGQYTNWPAMIGFSASYGTEAFNDNHFHYGYFMVGAALLGTEDTNFLAQYGGMARRVAKEYANWERSDTNFPFFRTFDIWEGHSWAGGLSSGGGENQESSSEAMNSWVGLFLMGNMLGDDAMTAAGAMGYSMESAAVNEYWQDMYRTNLPAGYGKGMVGILQSGGNAYATYFDGDPAWIHGIQWVPANHWNNYLARNPVFASWQLTNLWTERVLASQYGINGFTLTDANNANALGGYLGNYVLGFQLLFDADGVAGIMDDAYATNGAVANDPVYSGITYYLDHSLRSLGAPDTNYYTSLPTSQVYLNARTGQRTIVLFNPAPTNQTVTLYNSGVIVKTLAVAPGATAINPNPSTNAASPVVATIHPGAQISWPTTNNVNWTLQSANAAGTNVAWATLLGPATGNGSTNTYFDLLWPMPHLQYRVLQTTAGSTSLVVNGGFETGSGSVVSNWVTSGSQLPQRVSTSSHGGQFSMSLAVTNATATPNNSEIDQNVVNQGGANVVPGQTYNFSFWAQQISSGVSLVQNYRVMWLNNSGASLGDTGFTSFTGGNGVWKQINLGNLVAPANAVNVLITIYATTGAVAQGNGNVLLDDIAFSYATVGQTNVISTTVQPGVQVNWPTTVGKLYDVQLTSQVAGNNWANLVSAIAGSGGTNTVTDLFGTNQLRFYRVVQEP